MKNLYLITLLLTAVTAIKANNNLSAERSELRFTENKGQVADLEGKPRPDILFTAHSRGVKLFVNHTGIHYQFMRSFEKPKEKSDSELPGKFDRPETDSTHFYRMDMQLVGANPNATVVKEGEGSDYENYYLAHCPNGILGVKNYKRITYQNIYPNIDWVIYSKGYYMEYDFVVKPGGNIADIKIKYNGAIDLKLDAQGNLHATTPLGKVTETAPFTYQSNKQKVESSFLLQNNLLAFKVGEHNNNENLVIDPVGEWATYYGAAGTDYGYSVATDAVGNVYLVGYTGSSTGIAFGGFQNTLAGSDAFLVKFDTNGNRLWATYYGGSSSDYGKAVATDASGNVYLAGETNSDFGIASGGFQNNFAGDKDAFLVKFNSQGNRLWATYYGGSSDEYGKAVTTDASGNVYLVGFTSSSAGIASSSGHQQNTGGGWDAFLVKFNSTGSRLWATFYGGSSSDGASSVATDVAGNIYLAGYTQSTSAISSGGHQNTHGGGGSYNDAFLAKFNSSGSRLWATYYGGSDADWGGYVATDVAGNIYLAGSTNSSSAISSGGFQNTFGGFAADDAFLVKFNSSGSRLWATYYGGNNYDIANSVATDAVGNILLFGITNTISGIATGGFQNNFAGDQDAFLVKFNSQGNRLWSSYFGGNSNDWSEAITTDALGNAYIAGRTESNSNIASGGFQNSYSGWGDAFLKKIRHNCYPPLSPVASNVTNSFCPGDSLLFNGYYIKTAGTFRDTLYSICGYDSVYIVLQNSIKNVPVKQISVKKCPDAIYNFNGTLLNNPGTYRDTLPNAAANGCDSIVQLTLNNHPLYTASVNTQTYDSACASFSGLYVLSASYQLPGLVQSYLWSNSSTAKNIFVTQPGTYTVQVIDTNGCTSLPSAPIVISSFPSVTNCGGSLLLETDSVVNYFDTLDVVVRIKDPDSIFSIFAKLNYNQNLLEMVSSEVGNVLGSNIIYQPPIATNGKIDFGMTRTPGQQGVIADGVVYTFRFKLTNLPNLAFNAQSPTETVTLFWLTNPVVNDVLGAQRNVRLKPWADSTRIRYYVPVWPGDLNNDKSCNVADILPIGYFYNRTGPARPNASLQWIAQPGNLGSGSSWGLVKTNKNDNAWAVFADANGNGTVDLADQNAIGFNLGNIHALTNNDNTLLNESRANEPPLETAITETQIDSTQLPYTLNVKIKLGDLSNTANDVLGVAFNVLFDPECVDTNDITSTYTNLFGSLGTTYIKIEDFRAKGQGKLGIGVTRFNTTGINADGDDVLTITFKLNDGCYDGWFNVTPHLLACNDPAGNDILLAPQPDSVRIMKTNNQPVGIESTNGLKNHIALYPNPSKGTVYIQSSLTESFRAEVFNSMGQLMLSEQKRGGEQLDLTKAASGVYYIKITTGNSTASYKIVKE